MYQTYAAAQRQRKTTAPLFSAQGPSLADLQRARCRPRSSSGRRSIFPPPYRPKWRVHSARIFSGIQLHESQTVAEAGADAVTMGRHIAFAPGKLSAPGGQELLGHELSHVVSQARGEVSGRGFLDNSAWKPAPTKRALWPRRARASMPADDTPLGILYSRRRGTHAGPKGQVQGEVDCAGLDARRT